MRLIEDFLARTQQARCYDLKETADVLAKVTAAKCLMTMTVTVASEEWGK